MLRTSGPSRPHRFLAPLVLALASACDSGGGGGGGSGAAALQEIVITPTALQLPQGFTEALVATGNYSDGTSLNLTAQVLWTTSDPAIVTVGTSDLDRGVVTGIGLGEADVSAELDSVVGVCRVVVVVPVLNAITVTPDGVRIATGTVHPFTCTASFQGGYQRDSTIDAAWSSTDSGVAIVGNGPGQAGLVTGVARGECEIVATLFGFVDRAALRVVRVDLLDSGVAPGSRAGAPRAVIDDAGATHAAWSYEGEDPGRIFTSSRLGGGGGWSAKQELAGVIEVALDPVMASAGAGTAFLVWSGSRSLWSARRDPAAGWSASLALATGPPTGDYAPDIVLVADSAGGALVAWRTSVDSTLRTKAYTDGVGWGPTTLLADLGETREPLALAGNAAGDAILVWQAGDAGSVELDAARYTVAGGWEAAVPLHGSTLFLQPSVAIDAAGNAKVAFIDFSVFPASHLLVSSFDPAIGWDTPVLVSDQAVPREPAIGIDATGAAMVAWRHAAGAGTSISVSRFVVGDDWQEPELVKSSPGGSPQPLPPWLDGAGAGTAFWITDSFEDGTKLELARFDAIDGWSAIDSFDFIGAQGSVGEVTLHVRDNGRAVVGWVESLGGGDSVYVHEF